MAIGDPNASARDYLREILTSYGLESLVDWALDGLARGLNETQVLQELRQQPQFVARFPAINARVEAGLSPLTPGEYIEYEARARQLMREAGMPPQFYDQPQDFYDLLVNDRSLNEVQSVIQEGYLRVTMAPQEVRDVFAEWFGPEGDSALAAFFLDGDKALPTLRRMAEQAQVGGAGRRFDFSISKNLADEIAAIGATGQASNAFEQLNQQRGYLNETITETTDITEQQGVEATFGLNAESQDALRRRQQERAAQFGGSTQGGAPGTAEDYTRR